jgi:hypothetical protein
MTRISPDIHAVAPTPEAIAQAILAACAEPGPASGRVRMPTRWRFDTDWIMRRAR